jgi:hypothetical protein
LLYNLDMTKGVSCDQAERGPSRDRCEEKRPRYINGQEIPHWEQGPTVSEAVFHLGRKGWLLLSDHSALQLGFEALTLIHPKQ